MTIMQHAFEQALTPPMPYRVKEYLEKREVGTTFSTAALCEALSIPHDNLNDRNLVGLALAAAAKRKYVTEIDRQGRTVTYRLDKDGEWNVMERRTSPAAPSITGNARTLLTTWPVGSQMSVGSVAVQLGHKKLSKEVSVVRSSLWKFVQEGWLKSLGGGNFEIVRSPLTDAEINALPDTMPDQEFDKFVKAYAAPFAPDDGPTDAELAEIRREREDFAAAQKTFDEMHRDPNWKASDPDLQMVLDGVLHIARQIRDMQSPEPHKGLDDYTMDELLDAIALKRMSGGRGK